VQRDIIHPDLLTDLHRFFSSVCTIQEVPTPIATDAAGEEILAFVDLADHVDLPCTIAPSGGQEVRKPDKTYVIASHHVTLAGHYPTVIEKMRAVVNGTALDILLVESDSQSETTRLACQIAR